MDRPRLALVGVGRWGRNILRDLRALDVEVVAVARSATSVDAARAGGAAQVVASTTELPDVDGVVVATTIGSHASVILDLLDLDVPVFCEKPLTNDADAADEIVRRAGERVFVMDKWRYHPGVLELARIASSGELGGVVGLRCIRQGWGNNHRDDADDLWVLVPHDLSIALEVLGHVPEPRAANGFVGADGVGTMTALLGDRPWVSIDAGGLSEERRRRIELITDGGVAWLADGWATTVGVARSDQVGGEGWESRPVGDDLPLLAELRAFVAHLGGGPPPKSSAAEGAAIVRTVARIRAMAGLG